MYSLLRRNLREILWDHRGSNWLIRTPSLDQNLLVLIKRKSIKEVTDTSRGSLKTTSIWSCWKERAFCILLSSFGLDKMSKICFVFFLVHLLSVSCQIKSWSYVGIVKNRDCFKVTVFYVCTQEVLLWDCWNVAL